MFLKIRLLFMVLFGVIALNVSADQYHYKDILIGDRASGLAGAYAAISDDPAGLYYNPAGIVRAPDGQLSASANAYNQTVYTYDNINSSNKKWVRTSTASIANFFGVFQPLGEGGLAGFSIVVPDVNKANQDETFHNYPAADPSWTVNTEVLNYKEDDFSMLLGPSYAYKLTEDFAVGGTLYLHYRSSELEFRQHVALSNAAGENLADVRYQKYTTKEYGVKPSLGFIWDVSKTTSLGARIAKTVMLSQSPMSQQYSMYNWAEDASGQISQANWVIPDPVGMQVAQDRELPFEATLGYAWFPSHSFLISSDIDFFSETKTYGSVLNFSLGSEYFLSPKLSTRVGIYTNNSNNKDLNQLVNNRRTTGFDVDQIGITFSTSVHNRLSVMTFGFNYLNGTGKAQLSQQASKLQDLSISSLTVYIATSMNF